MEIATVLNVHANSDVNIDTIDSIFTYVTEKVAVVVDGFGWDKFKSVDLPVHKVKGYRHGQPRAPYKNVALGLMTITDHWPEADWYCYCEYDTLFASDRFKKNLQLADESDVWMLGFDGRVDPQRIPLVEAMLGEPLTRGYYMIGCCQFFSAKFMNTLKDIRFFDRFLNMVSSFPPCDFPHYKGYDISENLYPSLARHFGGNLGVFATWDGKKWHGDGEHYPIRWQPELVEVHPEASILHPLKQYDHPARVHHRNIRQQLKKDKEWKSTKM